MKIHTLLTLSVVISCLGFVSGCASSEQTSAQKNIYSASASQYIELANTSADAQKDAYRLRAVERLLRDGELKRAQKILSQISLNDLNPVLTPDYHLLKGQVALANNNPNSALKQLSNIDNIAAMTREDARNYHETLARAYQMQGKALESVQQRMKLTHFLQDDEEKQENNHALFNTLKTVSKHSLESLIVETDTDLNLLAWAQLAYITQRDEQDSVRLAQDLQHWQVEHPNHPGNRFLPAQAPVTQQSNPNQLAVLLPLHGRLAPVGTAVRDGIMASYYQDLKKHSQQRIRFYDTSKEPVKTLYKKAISDGANFVIGPLSKPNVSQIASLRRLRTPTLSLNYTTPKNKKNLYQFGLSPKDEIHQAVQKAWKDGHRTAIIIAPNNTAGQDALNQFKKTWQHSGGSVVSQLLYNEKKLNPEIKTLLQINQSESRRRSLSRELKEKVKFIPRRRQDVDVIFLSANPKMARQIRPLLKFYYAGDLPVYATSQVYPGFVSTKRDRDIEGIFFCDIPFVLQKDQAIIMKKQNTLKALWPNTWQSYPRLYALGLDAYLIATRIQNLNLFPEYGLQATTGTLYLDKNNQLHRQLRWAQIKNGKPVELL